MNADIEILCKQLQLKATGAHAHVASKAEYYLRKFSTNHTGFKDGSFDRFLALVRGAAYRDEWKVLDDRMARWW